MKKTKYRKKRKLFNIINLIKIIIVILIILFTTNIKDFSTSKRLLETFVYMKQDTRNTIYCNVEFDSNNQVSLSKDIIIDKYKNRMSAIEWEHVVPQSKLPNDIAKADMYNLYPAIGSVNASRSNHDFAELGNKKASFGVCEMKIHNKQVEPPNYAKGNVARAYSYMADRYQGFSLTKEQQTMFEKWDKLDPVDKYECHRTKIIGLIQRNENKFIKQSCIEKGLWTWTMK